MSKKYLFKRKALDLCGKEIKPEDFVVCPVLYGRSAVRLKFGKVLEAGVYDVETTWEDDRKDISKDESRIKMISVSPALLPEKMLVINSDQVPWEVFCKIEKKFEALWSNGKGT